MAAPVSLIEGTRAFARDFARDRMPRGYLWDMSDLVPNMLDAELTSRGGWTWGSTSLGAEITGGIYAPYKAGDSLLVVTAAGQLYSVGLTDPFTATSIAAVPACAQNPVMQRDWVFTLDDSQATAPRVITRSGTTHTVAAMSHATAPKARYGVVYKDRLVVANIPGNEQQVLFSYPGFVLKDDANTGNPVTMKWDALSFINSSRAITGLAAMRSMLLVFHAGSVERIRGSIPPGTDIASDMFLESLFDRAGCTDARSIAYWNDNCIFADERGIHLTDGSIVRNLISQGGLLYFWRTLYRQRLTIAAATFLDYYIITVRRTDGISVTLVVDLNRRTFFRFTNIKATAYIQSVGAQEKLWGGRSPDYRLAEHSNCFFPVVTSAANQDADGTPVLPSFETAWYRLGEEGRKRVRHAYFSYDVQAPGGAVAQEWRREYDDPEPDTNGHPEAAALAPILALDYLTSPLLPPSEYVEGGQFPPTTEYKRLRMAVGKQPYGVAFRMRQLAPSSVTRIYDLAVEQWPKERSAL